GIERGFGCNELGLVHGNRVQRAAVVFRAEFAQRRVATFAHTGDDLLDTVAQCVRARLRRARECLAPGRFIQGIPVQSLHASLLHANLLHASIFSTGSTNISRAPAFLISSSWRQLTSPAHSACSIS